MEDIFVVMHKVIGALLLTISLTGCGSTYYADQKIDTSPGYRPVGSSVELFYNLAKTTAYSVPKESRQEHEHCVFMILDNGNVGESCKWNTSQAKGSVRILRIRPNMCHDLTSTVYYKGNSKSWNDLACPANNSNKWIFYDE